jgi:hypothetical protein
MGTIGTTSFGYTVDYIDKRGGKIQLDVNQETYSKLERHDQYDQDGIQLTSGQLSELTPQDIDKFVEGMALKSPPDLNGLATLYNDLGDHKSNMINTLFNNQETLAYGLRGQVVCKIAEQLVQKSDAQGLIALYKEIPSLGIDQTEADLLGLTDEEIGEMKVSVANVLKNTEDVPGNLKNFFGINEITSSAQPTAVTPNTNTPPPTSGVQASGVRGSASYTVSRLSMRNNGTSGNNTNWITAEEVLLAVVASRMSRSSISNDEFERQYGGMPRTTAENIMQNLIKEFAQQNRLGELFFNLQSENGVQGEIDNARAELMKTMLEMYGGNTSEAKTVTSFIDTHLTNLASQNTTTANNARIVFSAINVSGDAGLRNLANVAKHLLNGNASDKLLLTSLMLYQDNNNTYPFQQALRYLVVNNKDNTRLIRDICNFTENIKVPASMADKEGNIALLRSLMREFANSAALVKYDRNYDGQISLLEMKGEIRRDSSGNDTSISGMTAEDAMLFYKELADRGAHFAYGAESRLGEGFEVMGNKINVDKSLTQVMEHLIKQNSNRDVGAIISTLMLGGYAGGVAALAGVCPPLAVLIGVFTGETIVTAAAAGIDVANNAQASSMLANSLPVIQRIFQDGGLLTIGQSELNKLIEGLCDIWNNDPGSRDMVKKLLEAIYRGIDKMDNADNKRECVKRMQKALGQEKITNGHGFKDIEIGTNASDSAVTVSTYSNEITLSGNRITFEAMSEQNENRIDFTDLAVDTTPRTPEYKPKADDANLRELRLSNGTIVNISGYIKDSNVKKILGTVMSPTGLDTKPEGIIRGSDFAALNEGDRLSLIKDIFSANFVPALSEDQKLEVLLALVEKWGGEDSPGGKALLDTLFKYCYNGENNNTNGHPVMSPAFTRAINQMLISNKGNGVVTRYLENPQNYANLRKVVRHCLDADDKTSDRNGFGLVQSRNVLRALLSSSDGTVVRNTLYVIREAFDATGGAIWDSDVRRAISGPKGDDYLFPNLADGKPDPRGERAIGDTTINDALTAILTKSKDLKLERALPPNTTNAASPNDRFADAKRRIETAENVLRATYSNSIDAALREPPPPIDRNDFIKVLSENCPYIDLRALSETQAESFIKAFADNMKLVQEINKISGDKNEKINELINHTLSMFTAVDMGEAFAKAYSSEHYVLGIYAIGSYENSSRKEQVDKNGGNNTQALNYQYIAPGSTSEAVALIRGSSFGFGIDRGNTPYMRALTDNNTTVHRGNNGNVYFLVNIDGKSIMIQPKITESGSEGINLENITEAGLKDALLAQLRKENNVEFLITMNQEELQPGSS